MKAIKSEERMSKKPTGSSNVQEPSALCLL